MFPFEVNVYMLFFFFSKMPRFGFFLFDSHNISSDVLIDVVFFKFPVRGQGKAFYSPDPAMTVSLTYCPLGRTYQHPLACFLLNSA